MKRILPLPLCLTLLLGAPAVAEQASADKPADKTSSSRTMLRGAQSIGDEIVPHKFYGDLRDLPRAPVWEEGDTRLINPRRWHGEPKGEYTPAKLDPLVTQQRSQERGQSFVTEIHNFEGVDNGATQPPDPTGEVGKNYYIHAVNSSTFAIYDKVTGAQVVAPTAMDSLGSGGCTSGAGDPIIVYDAMAERWLMSEFTFGNDMCVYISMTDDPVTGGWCNYELTAPTFPDYPKYAVWPNAYVVSTNESGGTIYAFDRANMMNCDTARPFQRMVAPALPGLGFQAFTPADVEGATGPDAGVDEPAYLLRQRDTELGNQGPNLPTSDLIEIWSFDVDWDNSQNTTLTQEPDISVAEFDSNLCPPISFFSCVPQPISNTDLDPLLEVIMYPVTYRKFSGYESIVGVFQTDIGDFEDHSGERWFELRRSSPNDDWALHQEGTYSPDEEHRFMATIAQDGDGNILMAYALSSENTSPSVRYTGRLSTDPTGVMTQPEITLIAGTGHDGGSSRYGDYSQMSVDPVDNCTFWFTVEYTEGNFDNSLRIGAVKFDSCVGGGGGPEVFDDSFEGGDCSAWSSNTGGC